MTEFTTTSPAATCCFTGHRDIPSEKTVELKGRLMETIKGLYGRGVRTFRCGGALGFDTLAAITVLRLKADPSYSDIRLSLFLPCRDQDKFWQRSVRVVYARIK